MATLGIELTNGVQGVQGVQSGYDGLIQDPIKNETVKTQNDKIDEIKNLISDILQQKTFENNDRKINGTSTKEITEFRGGSNAVIGAAQTGANVLQNFSNENIPAIISDSANQLGKSLISRSKETKDDGFSKTLLGLGTAGVMAALTVKGTQELSKPYESATEGLDKLLLNYGNIGDNARLNSNSALTLRRDLSSKIKDTGMGYEDFVSLTNSFAGSGVRTLDRAGDLARESALWARRTGSDISQVAGVAGLVERLGGNGSDFLSNSYKEAKASGLTDNQYGEFLEGIKSAMEQGISKGFKLSADDIGKNLSYVSMLSGNNPIWEGEYGAQKYNNISNAMSNNTSLQNTSSLLLYQATKNTYGGSELDVLKKMEEGQWGDPKFLESLRNTLSGAYDSDRMSQIASIKEMFGLNWTGGEQVLDIISNTTNPEELRKKINEVVTDNNYTSDETNRTNALNDINKAVVDIGQSAYNTGTSLSDIGANVANIYEAITGPSTLVGKEKLDDVQFIEGEYGEVSEKYLDNPDVSEDKKLKIKQLIYENWQAQNNNDKTVDSWEVNLTDVLRELENAIKENTNATKDNSNSETIIETQS